LMRRLARAPKAHDVIEMVGHALLALMPHRTFARGQADVRTPLSQGLNRPQICGFILEVLERARRFDRPTLTLARFGQENSVRFHMLPEKSVCKISHCNYLLIIQYCGLGSFLSVE
jgi:hypothetical protein